MSRNYYDIGHRGGAVLWIFRNGNIETNSVVEKHSSVGWPGEEHPESMWVGRYEPETGKCSVSIPIGYESGAAPSWLVERLQEKFGSGIDIVTFVFGQVETCIPDGAIENPVVRFELNRRKGR